MQRWWWQQRDNFGNPAAGATATVYLTGTTTKATLYNGNDTTDTATNAIANPIITGSDGVVYFAASDGDYDIVISGANFTAITMRRVNLLDGTGAAYPAGSIASVGLAMPGEFSVAGSPLTSSGTITVSKATQAANLVFAGPTSGGAAAPTFRVQVLADLPAFGPTASTVFGSATQVAQATTNAQGIITALANVTVTPAFSNVTGKPTTVVGYGITDAVRQQFVQTATVVVVNTSSETTMTGAGAGSLTIPAGTILAGTSIRVRAKGYHSTTISPTIRFRLKLGGVVLLDSGTVSAGGGTNVPFEFDGDIVFYTIGAAGTLWTQGETTCSNRTMHATTAATVIDTTLNQTLDLTAQWSAASTFNTMTITNLVFERIG